MEKKSILYYDLIEKWFEDTITKENYELMIKSLITGDIKIFGKLLKQISDKKYAITLINRGVINIKEIAIVLKGKEIYIKEKNLLLLGL